MKEYKPTYVVWRRGDGFVGATAGRPLTAGAGELSTFTELLRTDDWLAARARIRAERTAIVMNEDIYPIVASAESNRMGVYI